MTQKLAQSMRALADQKDSDVTKDNLFKADPRKVKVQEGFNVRFMNKRRRDYIDSMKGAKRQGAIFPAIDVKVVDGEILIVDGHNRHQMDLELIEEGFPVPFIICREFRGDEAAQTAHMVGTGRQGLQLLPVESGHGYLRQRNWGWEVKRIAEHSGVSDTYVENCMMLAESAIEIQRMMAEDLVSAQVVIQVLRRHGKQSPKSLDVLRDLLAKEKDGGGRKITDKTLNGPSIPRNVVGKVVSSLNTFYTRLSDTDRQSMQTVFESNEAELDGKSITLPASTLKALLEAHGEVQAVFDKQAAKAKRKKARAEQAAAASDGEDETFSVDDAVAQHDAQAAA